jgi:nucleoside-diphosphate-sugar epimerase
MSTVVITGAAGTIGRAVVPLLARHHELRLLDITLPEDAARWPGTWRACSVTDGPSLSAALGGADALIHLAGIPTEAPWADLLSANIDGTRTALESAQRAGVRRVLLASSVHAAGYLSARSQGDATTVRPDTYYGVSKAVMEALGALFADRFGMTIVSARICTFAAEPTPGRTVATWLSIGDAARLFEAAIALDRPGHHVVWGVSDNGPRWFPLGPGAAIGFQPADDAVKRLTETTGQEPSSPDGDLAFGGPFLDLPLGQTPTPGR